MDGAHDSGKLPRAVRPRRLMITVDDLPPLPVKPAPKPAPPHAKANANGPVGDTNSAPDPNAIVLRSRESTPAA